MRKTGILLEVSADIPEQDFTQLKDLLRRYQRGYAAGYLIVAKEQPDDKEGKE